MVLKKWDELPERMKNDKVKFYFDILTKKRISLIIKRIFDLLFAIVLLVLMGPIFLLISILIKLDSQGPIFYRQIRITQYGKEFYILKFRTMKIDSDKIGTSVTVHNDTRITKMGNFLRKLRLDEIPQLMNIIAGDMSFVGTRPEVKRYVNEYTDEMFATLLLPAGVTSLASIKFKNEAELLELDDDIDEVYIKKILPEKMNFNFIGLQKFSFFEDIKILFRTLIAVIRVK